MNDKTAQSLASARQHPSSLNLLIAITDTHEEMFDYVASINADVTTLNADMETLLDHFGLDGAREHRRAGPARAGVDPTGACSVAIRPRVPRTRRDRTRPAAVAARAEQYLVC